MLNGITALAAFPDQQTLPSQAYFKDFSKVFICDKSLLLLIREVLGDQPENLYLSHLSYSGIFHNCSVELCRFILFRLDKWFIDQFSMKRECGRIV